jgi:hypothetical protein
MMNSGQSEQREVGHKAAHAPEFLIANLELEFHVSPIRISNLNFPNRKFLAIFPLKLVTDGEPCAAFSSPPASGFEPPEPNRYTAIRIPRNSHKTNTKSKS